MLTASILENYCAYNNLDLSAFEGLWIAIFNGSVIASGSKVKEVYSQAMDIAKSNRILLTKVPKKNVIEIL